MGGGSEKTTQVSNNEPWAASQPYIKSNMAKASDLAKNSTPYSFSGQTSAGLSGLENMAKANTGGAGLSGQYQGIIDSGGFNAPQQTALQGVTRTATDPVSIMSNPAYMTMRSNLMDDVQNRVNENASAAGRYGGAVHTGNLTREIGNVAAGMDVNELQRQLAAQAAAQSSLFSMGQAGQGNLGAAYQGALIPSSTLQQVGGAYDDLAYRNRNLPWENLAKANAIQSGQGSVSTTTQTAPGQNPFASALGYGLAASSLFGF